MSDPTHDEAEYAVEARVFARYLVGRPPAAELVARYGNACRTLWPEAASPGDPRLAFVRRHPWSVGPLDAAAALLDPAGLLRSRVLVMAALLEATPSHADDFLPRGMPLPALFLRLATAGVAAFAGAVVGVLLWPLAGRRSP